MAWFKVDDQLAFNSKIMLAGNSAMGLWVRAGSWSSAQLTGGHIPGHMANAMANECDADALVMAGLWHEAEGGYQFHDWSDFQPDAEAEKEKRKATAEARSAAGKAGAEARWAKERDGKTDGKRNGKTAESHGKAMANEWQTDAPVPSRPDPVPKGTKKESDSDKPNSPPKSTTPEHQATDAAYEQTGKAFNFIATRAISKWMIHDRGLKPENATQTIVAVYNAGKPITRQTCGQYIDGKSGTQKPTTASDRRLQQGYEITQRAGTRNTGPNDPFRIEIER